MAAFTSTIDGAWSAQATWGGSGPPGNGDTATVATNVHVDTNTTVGTSGATGTTAVTVNAGKVLTIDGGATLNLRGDLVLTTNGASYFDTLTMSAGSGLTFNPPDGSTYKLTCGQRCRIKISGSSGSHVTWTSNPQVATGGNGWVNSAALNRTGMITATYWDCTKIGDGTNPIVTPTYFSGDANSFSLTNCTFSQCGAISPSGNIPADGTFTLATCSFSGTVPTAPFTGGSSTANSTGSRTVSGCVFDKIFGSAGSAFKDFTFSKCYFGDGIQANATSQWTSMDQCFLRNTLSTGRLGPYGNISNCYVLGDVDGGTTGMSNWHYLNNPAGYSITINANIFECTNASDNQGDCVLVGDTTASQTVTITRNIYLPDMVNGFTTGNPLTILGSSVTHVTVSLEHCTCAVGTGSGIGLQDSGTLGPNAGTVTSIRGNLIWSKNTGTTALKSYAAATNANTRQDICSPSNCDYNSGWHLSTTQSGGYTNTGNGYGSAWSATPGTHDADVLAGTIGALDPQFNDSTRCLWKWGKSVGQSGSDASATLVNNTLTYIQGDPTNRIPALMTYVRQGFKVKASGLKNASYPGDAMTTDADGTSWNGGGPTIGAMTWFSNIAPLAMHHVRLRTNP